MKIKQETLESMRTSEGKDLYSLSFESNVLLLFLRHFGCIFCREALGDVSKLQQDLARENVKMVLVHMSSKEIAEKYFVRYHLEGIPKISDPNCLYYKEFNLMKGTFNQLFGFRTWVRGIDAGIVKGHGWGVQLGDGFQMPGVFVIHNGKITSEFRHKAVYDKPDYKSMLKCE